MEHSNFKLAKCPYIESVLISGVWLHVHYYITTTTFAALYGFPGEVQLTTN
jgi:hypothetical protein